MDHSRTLMFGREFGELHYRNGRTLDGIERARGPVLTTETTYRLLQGFPDVYLTALYRWTELPITRYISEKAVELGVRLGKNTLVVPAKGHEEPYWADAVTILNEIAI